MKQLFIVKSISFLVFFLVVSVSNARVTDNNNENHKVTPSPIDDFDLRSVIVSLNQSIELKNLLESNFDGVLLRDINGEKVINIPDDLMTGEISFYLEDTKDQKNLLVVSCTIFYSAFRIKLDIHNNIDGGKNFLNIKLVNQ